MSEHKAPVGVEQKASGEHLTAEDQLLAALLPIFEATDVLAVESKRRVDVAQIDKAASDVLELSKRLGDYWRRIAIARLATAATDRRLFENSIRILGFDPEKLRRFVDTLKYAQQPVQQMMAYEYVTTKEEQGQCMVGGPITDASYKPSAGEAKVTTVMTLKLTTPQLAKAADPQNWASSCGLSMFKQSFIPKVIANDTIGMTPSSSCEAQQGTALPQGSAWGNDKIANWHKGVPFYERFDPFPGYSYSNVLDIWIVPSTYSLKYELENPLCAEVSSETEPGALYEDGGSLTSVANGSSGLTVTATKVIAFNNVFKSPYSKPADLARKAYYAFQIIGPATQQWLCCNATGDVTALPDVKKKKKKKPHKTPHDPQTRR